MDRVIVNLKNICFLYFLLLLANASSSLSLLDQLLCPFFLVHFFTFFMTKNNQKIQVILKNHSEQNTLLNPILGEPLSTGK